jgi:hypothetical protein
MKMDPDPFGSGALKAFDLESLLFWRGFRSYVFHVPAESKDDPRLREIRSLLTHPYMCFSVEELSGEDAAHVMEKEFRIMQSDLHNLKIAGRHLPKKDRHYEEELTELHSSVNRRKGRILRVKLLVDADKMERSVANKIISKVKEIRNR